MSSINKDDSLWTNLDPEDANFLRRFRFTACPVMGDDDIDEDEDEDDARPAGPPTPAPDAPPPSPPSPPERKEP